MTPFVFRRALADDLDRLVAVHMSGYPDARPYDARVRNFTANPLGPLDDLWVAIDTRGSLVGHAFLFALTGWYGGRPVAVGGIASLAVAPEARGRGVATHLLAHLHAVSLERGDALTLLYPFRLGFYARLGYAPTSRYRALKFSPAALPALPPGAPALTARPATGADRPALASCWGATARAGTGALARSDRVWDARLSHEAKTWFVVEGEAGPEGYVAWSLVPSETGGETTLVVHEMATRKDRAASSLWALVAAQGDQVHWVETEVADDDPLVWVLGDPDGLRGTTPSGARHPVGTVAAGPMIRVTDVPRALEARGWRQPGRLVIEVDGARYLVDAHDGAATVVPASAPAEVTTDVRTLASVALGGHRAADAARLGRLTAASPAALERAGAMLALPPFFSHDRF
ncbi:MAG: GNAT family N-acetyltransferase [Polyangiaceae bacterium]|nr:GNAT family N-acetyltransferase [Polyangiaceae bacterium]